MVLQVVVEMAEESGHLAVMGNLLAVEADGVKLGDSLPLLPCNEAVGFHHDVALLLVASAGEGGPLKQLLTLEVDKLAVVVVVVAGTVEVDVAALVVPWVMEMIGDGS